MDHSFRRELRSLHKEAEVLDAGDHPVHRLADTGRQVRQQLDLLQLALGFLGSLLAFAAMLAQQHLLAEVIERLLAGRQGVKHAMHGQVRVAANRRGEVAVVLAVESVVPFIGRAIDRLLHAAEHGVVHCMFAGRAGNCGDDPLDLEAALQAVALDPQLFDKARERLQLPQIGLLVNAAE